jgi:serine O-acetyltransferase
MNISRKNIERENLLNSIRSQRPKSFFSLIKSDISRYQSIFAALYSIGFWPVLFYRIAHYFHKHHIGVLGYFLQVISNIVFGCEISRKLEAGPGFLILHSQGIFAGPYVVLGKGVALNSGCFIGSLMISHDPNDYPVCGDYTYFSPGSKAFGGIAIGERSVIGPNAVIIRNIPADHTVLPSQIHVIKKYERK